MFIKTKNVILRLFGYISVKIPWTKRFRKDYSIKLTNMIRRRLRAFNYLPFFDNAKKKALYRPFKKHVKKCLSYNFYYDTIEEYTLGIFLIILFSLFIITYFYSFTIFGVPFFDSFAPFLSFKPSSYAHVLILYFLFFIVKLIILIPILLFSALFLTIFLLPLLILKPFNLNTIFTRIFSLIWVGALVIFLSFNFRPVFNKAPCISSFNFILLFGFLGATIFIAALLTILLPLTIYLGYRKRTIIPDSLLINTLYFILLSLQSGSKRWDELEFKNNIISNLEYVAILIQLYLPKQLITSDSYTNLWISETFNKIAFTIRDLKKWVITPNPETKDDFTHKIISIFTNTVSGNWDYLTKESSEISYTHPPLRVRIFQLISCVFTAFIPGLIFIGLQNTSLSISGKSKEYIIIGLFIWACITLLSVFDPLLSEKISALKDIARFLPGFGKSKDHK